MIKNRFYKGFESPKVLSCPVGSHIIDPVIYDIDEETGKVFKTKGKKIDIYKQTQAYAKTCGVKYILSQVANGNLKLEDLDKPYTGIDMTKIPDNIHDLYKSGADVVNSYDNDKILQSIYKNKNEFKKDLEKGVDISKKVNDFTENYKKRYLDFFYKKFANKKVDPKNTEKVSTENEIKKEVK